ncbi:MAG: hypothetical protein MJ118_01115 [Clostridia bacterium]|nr:hypothetical protein [Clostridia bacterium]
MSASRIKNLILLILLLAVVCLLIAVVPARYARVQSRRAENELLAELLAEYGVTLDPDIIPESENLYAVELTQADAAAVAEALLGQDAERSEDSTRHESTFTGAAGSVSLNSSGAFSAALIGREHTGNVEKDAKKVLRAIGFQTDTLQTVRSDSGEYTVTAVQSLLGTAVFSDGLRLQYQNGALCAMEGVFFPESAEMTRISEQTCISCADALVQLLSCRNELGWVGSQIVRAVQGFFPSESASGAVRFVPCWRIDTDTDSFFINGVSREVRRIGEG